MKPSHRDLQYLLIVIAEGGTITLDASVAFSLRNFCFPHVPATVNLTWEKDGFQFWCFPHLSIVSLKGISYIIWQKACLPYQKDLIDISTQWTQFRWHLAFRQPFVFSTLFPHGCQWQVWYHQSFMLSFLLLCFLCYSILSTCMKVQRSMHACCCLRSPGNSYTQLWAATQVLGPEPGSSLQVQSTAATEPFSIPQLYLSFLIYIHFLSS